MPSTTTGFACISPLKPSDLNIQATSKFEAFLLLIRSKFEKRIAFSLP